MPSPRLSPVAFIEHYIAAFNAEDSAAYHACFCKPSTLRTKNRLIVRPANTKVFSDKSLLDSLVR